MSNPLDSLTPEQLEGAQRVLSEEVHQITLAQELIRAHQQGLPGRVDEEKHKSFNGTGKGWLDTAISGSSAMAKKIADEKAAEEAAKKAEAERIAAENAASQEQFDIANRVMATLTPAEQEAVRRTLRS